MRLSSNKYINLLGLILIVVFLNILLFIPGWIDLGARTSALGIAFTITWILANILVLLYASYMTFFKPPAVVPVKNIEKHEDYLQALGYYKGIKVLEEDVTLVISQLERMKKKREAFLNVLNHRFDPGEMSFKKFASVSQEVEKLLYLNVRSILNRLHVFDKAEYGNMLTSKPKGLTPEMMQKKNKVYNDYLTYLKTSLNTNEEILLKLDQLMLEISRLDSFEEGDIEQMPCMKEIDLLIKQTKLYRD